MSDTITIRPAVATDYPLACNLLETEKLPVSDIRKDMQHFFLAESAGTAIGLIGLDGYPPFGLLRSMVVLPEFRNKGIAGRLVHLVEVHARTLDIQTLYLITNSAQKFFVAKGFETISGNDLPPAIKGLASFNGLCPASSKIMKKPC